MPPIPQADPSHQRVDARGELAVRLVDGRTRIQRLVQESSAKIRLPRMDGDPLQAVLINTAGGLTGGDRIAWTLSVGPGASLVATTQACEKVYRAARGLARVTCTIDVARGGRVAWLPQETILFDASAMARSIEVDLAGDATGLFVEATLFGRRAMGETAVRTAFRDRWRIRQEGRLAHAEDIRFSGDAQALLDRAAVAGGAAAMATVLLVGAEAEHHLDAARSVAGPAGSASAWSVGGSGKLLARLIGADGYDLRKRLVAMIELLNGRAGVPKVWSL